MTGHEIGAALGVAALTAVAGDLTTRAGITAGTQDAFLAVAIGLARPAHPDLPAARPRPGAPSPSATATATESPVHYPLWVC